MQPRLDRLFGSSATKARITLSLVVALTLSLILALMLPAPVKAEENPEGPAAVAAEPSESPTEEPTATPTAAESDAEADPATNEANDESAGEDEADETIAGDEGDEEAAESDAKPTFRSRSANGYRFGAIGGGTGLPNCVAGEVYALSEDGKMYKLSPGESEWTRVNAGDIKLGGSLNGLGIYNDEQGNSTWYAYARSQVQVNGGYRPTITVYKNVNGNGWTETATVNHQLGFQNEKWPFGGIPLEKYKTNSGGLAPRTLEVKGTLLGGAVNPVDGSYWIMQYIPVGGEKTGYHTGTEVRLTRVDIDGTVTHKVANQTVDLFTTKDGEGRPVGYPNGDLAFDSVGNAFLVHTVYLGINPNSDGSTKIHVVPAKDTANKYSTSFDLKIQSRTRHPEKLGQNTGIAFDFPAGRLVVGSTENSKAFSVPQLNPVPGTLATGLTKSYDLASCSFPHTFELKKNVEGRADASDQFHLEVLTGSNDPVDDTTTTGNQTGIQAETVGPILTAQGAKFEIRESMAPGSKSTLDKYSYSLSCEEKAYNTPLSVEQSGGKNYVTIPNVPPKGNKSLRVECTFTNTPVYDLVVTKVDKDDASKVLAGAQFELWFDKDGDGAFDKSKDEKIAGPQATETDGKVRFTKLKARSYFLVETKAPTGYKLLAEPTVVTVAADQDETAVTVKNEKILGSVTWSKVDKDNEKPLKGSEWVLLHPASGASITVTDCVEDPCSGDDKDPAEGSFKVTGLALGSWTLTETTAPFGYKLPAKPDHPFELTEANAEKGIALGKIPNEKQDVPPLPHTGGLGSDAFLIAGGLVLLLALALGGGTYARRYRL